ncbi:MAG: DPP IV N-terminal domain-containing protein, partial [Bacteroidales bacterium]|nr:DPP IV N-terminal domain-containing protein [Bacteroidales bacterium]
MKRISLLLILSLNFFLLPAAKQEISLDSIISGTFRSASIPEIKSMQDGRYYTCIDENGQKIIQYSYLTGKQEAVILDIHNLKGVAPKKIVGYAFSLTEKRMIVWGEKDPIYRRSYTTEYYVYDVKRNFMEVLSENGSQRDAKFSPDGRSIAFSRGNNLFIKRLDYGTEIPVTTDGSENAI